MTDTEFLAAFESCALPKWEWTHAAHVRMAFLYMTCEHGGYHVALSRIRNGIRAYNASRGNAAGYHETITVAFARLLQDRLQSDPVSGVNFAALSVAHPDLFVADTLLRHYSRERLYSAEARVSFVAPDLEPLPDEPAVRPQP